MYLQTYDPVTGSIISERASELNFGDVMQGRHCTDPVLLRTLPDTETNITNLSVFLENDGGWSSAEFGYYTHPSFTANVESGGELMDNHFTESPNASSGSPGGVNIGLTDSTSDYLWLDIDVPSTQLGSAAITYRFIFNYT